MRVCKEITVTDDNPSALGILLGVLSEPCACPEYGSISEVRRGGRPCGKIRKNLVAKLDRAIDAFAVKQFHLANGFSHIQMVTVVIPALNEAENLKQILPRLPESICGHQLGVVLVNDGSDDDTANLARQYSIAVISTPISRGQGAALRLGYRLALAGGAAIIVTMDADGQNRPEEIQRLVEPIFLDQADYVIGSRVLGKYETDDPIRWLGVRVFSPLVSFLVGTDISDCSSGFRAMKASLIEKIIDRLEQRQNYAPELTIAVARRGFKVKEVPVTFLKRISGRSKKGHSLYYGFAFARAIFATWLRVI